MSVKSATSAPLSAKTAVNCAATETTNTKKSSDRLLLRSAAIAVRLRADRSGLGLLGDTLLGCGLLEVARYADALLPEERSVRGRCAWFCRMPGTSLEHPARGS